MWLLSTEMPKRSFIVQFSSDDKRDAFVRRLVEQAPQFSSSVYVSKRRPEAVVDVSPDDETLLVELAGPHGRVFDDVEFEAMQSSGD
jgi:hypothetical protein